MYWWYTRLHERVCVEERLLSPKRTLVIPYRTPADRSRRIMKGTVTYVEREGKRKKNRNNNNNNKKQKKTMTLSE